LHALTESEIKAKGLKGTPKTIVIYTNATGGHPQKVEDWPEGKKSKKVDFHYGKRAFLVNEVEFDKDTKTGMVHGTAYHNHALIEEAKLKLPIQEMPGIAYGGYIPHSAVYSAIKSKLLELKIASPIEFTDIELTDAGFVGRGRVLPTIPLIKDVGIEIVLA